jgi:mRNA-degrading endonuclease RelE of RelBE toxin-antitoxin system
MNYKVKIIPKFEKDLKKLVKKYPSLKMEYISLILSLQQNPKQGTLIGNNCYKLRLAIASKGKGKSGGARVISYFKISEIDVHLLSIYDKSDKENISDKELLELLKFIE